MTKTQKKIKAAVLFERLRATIIQMDKTTPLTRYHNYEIPKLYSKYGKEKDKTSFINDFIEKWDGDTFSFWEILKNDETTTWQIHRDFYGIARQVLMEDDLEANKSEKIRKALVKKLRKQEKQEKNDAT